MTVEELLNSKQVHFIPKGGDCLVRCLNPEHEDRNPSMRVDRITGIFGCFSCGYKGNIFTYFGETPNHLQVRRDLLKKAIQEKRSESIGLVFPKGSVPYVGDWRNIKPETYKKFEAFQHHDPDYIGRVVFPVRSISGRIVAFNGRHTTGGIPKYMISPAGAKMPLYPVVEPIQGSIVLVEGIFDMINLHDKGLDNTVCCFGTKNINEDKLRMLSIQGVESVDIFFDGDTAGQDAAAIVKEMCDRVQMTSRNICFKDKDPGGLQESAVRKLKSKLYE
jgi:DNA primase